MGAGYLSLMTALGLAQNFWHLLAARIGVGIGEAGCSPPAHSMIADYYPAVQRATALGIYSLGIPFGVMFGLFAGGWINEFFGWRAAFFVVGLPGILLALGEHYANRRAAWQRPPVTPINPVSEKRSNISGPKSVHVLCLCAYSLCRLWLYHMGPQFSTRSFGMGTGEIGTWLGLILGIPGGIGIALGGYLAYRFGARDPKWFLWTTAVSLLICVPLNFVVFMSTNSTTALLAMILPVLLGNFYQATTFSQTQGISALRMRAVAAGILLFIINIIGLGLGPQLVGILSDVLNPDFGDESLRYALLICSLVYMWAAIHYFIAGRHLGDDLIVED